MKIKLNQLLSNPFRNLGDYPINKEKIKGLVRSINDTTFWDNILARPSPDHEGKFEIAYGHHRLHALYEIHGRTSKYKIDIPVRDLDDATMLRIMANENASDWAMDTAVVTETVKATEQFLKDHPKYNLPPRSGKQYPHQGVPAVNIATFLGGIFTESLVTKALAIIHAVQENIVDDQAIKAIKEPTRAYEFSLAIKQAEKPVPIEKQRAIAKEIRDNDIGKRDIKLHVKYHDVKPSKKEPPDVFKFLHDNSALIERVTRYVTEVNRVRDIIEAEPNFVKALDWQVFRRACVNLNKALSELLNTNLNQAPEEGAKNGKEEKSFTSRSQRVLA
jgi:hypothetical protein